MKNIISTATNLKEHHVLTDGICSMCKDIWASTEHVLIFCPKVVEIWKTGSYWNILQRGDRIEIRDMAGVFRRCSTMSVK